MLRPAAFLLLLPATAPPAQQVADTAYRPVIAQPAFQLGQGPLVLIDEAHNNFHTASGRYAPFADLVRRDGYRVESLREPISKESLANARVLVIANAINAANVRNWARPIQPAFSDEEVRALRVWVEGGGALLLMADHMPFAGAAATLGKAFGLEFSDGFAVAEPERSGPFLFRRADSSLGAHPIIEGRSSGERVDSVATFTGQGFRSVGSGVSALFTLAPDVVLLEPDTAWVFNEKTTRRSGSGWLQGAALTAGKGRVVVFGEAAMFSAQLAGAQQRPMGMNAPVAAQNAQFLLNTMHWLSGLIE